jgi:hypothetical protein
MGMRKHCTIWAEPFGDVPRCTIYSRELRLLRCLLPLWSPCCLHCPAHRRGRKGQLNRHVRSPPGAPAARHINPSFSGSP